MEGDGSDVGISVDEILLVPEENVTASELPMVLILRILAFMPPNDIACTARFLCKEVKQSFSAPHHRSIRHSQPIPAHAFAWRYSPPGALRTLSFTHKQQLIALTAGTGATANLRLLLSRHPDTTKILLGAPTTIAAAAAAGHTACVDWLVEHASDYDREAHVCTAMQYGSLAEVECHLMELAALGHKASRDFPRRLIEAAAACTRPDAVDKLEWAARKYRTEARPLLGSTAAEAAANAGNLEALKWLSSRASNLKLRGVLEGAARAGSTAIVSWLLDTYWPRTPEGLILLRLPTACVHAAAGGHVDVLNRLLPLALWLVTSLGEAGDGAAEVPSGPLILRVETRPPEEYFLPGGVLGPCEEAVSLLNDCLDRAADGGQLGVLRALWPLGPRRPGLLPRLAGSGRVEAARWLWGRLAEQTGNPNAMGGALQPGSLEAEATAALQRAVQNADTAMVAFLLDEAGAAWVLDAEEDPAAFPQPPALLREQPTLMPLHRRAHAASTAPALEWLQRRGCPLECGGEALKGVLAAGDLPALRWLHARGMVAAADLAAGGRHEPLSPLAAAAEGGCEAMLEWLVEQGCAAEEGSRGYVAAGGRGDLDTLRCLRRLGVPWGEHSVASLLAPRGACAGVPAHCMLAVVRWLVGAGAPGEAEAAARAARQRGRGDVAAWVEDWAAREGSEGVTA